jgi:hypothetical protein
MLFCGLIAIQSAVARSSAVKQANVEQLTDQIRQIDEKLGALDTERADLESQSEQTRRDSAAMVAAGTAKLDRIQAKIGQAGGVITARKSELAALRARRTALVQDSLAEVTSFNGESTALKGRISQVQQRITEMQGELRTLQQRKKQLQQISQQTSDPQQAALLQEKSGYDSTVAAQQKLLDGIQQQLTQLVSDSTAQVASLQTLRSSQEAELQQIDAQIATVESTVAVAKNSLDQATARLAEKKGIVNASIQQLQLKKKSLTASATQSRTKIKKFETERKKLQLRTGKLLSDYEAGRAPIVEQLNSATQILGKRMRQQQLWTLVSEKHTIDSLISVARNQLDEVIQQAAGGKRAAKKQINEKEEQLNVLMRKQDTYNNIPGVRQAEAPLSSMTMSQKRLYIDQGLAKINGDIQKQTTLKTEAEQELARYDASNQVSSDPSIRRLRELDTLLAAEQQNNGTLTAEIESLESNVRAHTDSLGRLDASAYNEIGAFEGAYNNALSQRTAALARRDLLVKNQKAAYAAGSKALTEIITQMNVLRQRGSTVLQEIAAAQRRSIEAQQRAVEAQQKFDQNRADTRNNAARLADTIAEKERLVIGLTKGIGEMNAQLTRLETGHRDALSVLTDSLYRTDQSGSRINGELKQQINLRNGLKAEYDNELKSGQTALSALRSAASALVMRKNAIRKESSTLQYKRTSLITTLKNRIGEISSAVSSAEQNLANATAAYNAAVQDSINFEGTRKAALAKAKRSVAQQDSMLSIITGDIQDAAGAYQKDQADSAAEVSKRFASMVPYRVKIGKLDSLIAQKEQELSALKTRRSRVVADSVTTSQEADAALQQTALVLKRKLETIAALQELYALQGKEKQRIKTDAVSQGEQFRKSRQLHTSKIESQLLLSGKFQAEIEALTSERGGAEAALAAVENRSTRSASPKPTAAKSTIASAGDARAVIEEIYTLMAKDKMQEAKKLFTANHDQLLRYAAPDAVQMLEASFE